MALDKDKKIEIQQKLIEQLTKENAELKEQLLYAQSMVDDDGSKYENSIKEMEKAKNRYDELTKELEELKEKYRTYYDMYRKLTKRYNE